MAKRSGWRNGLALIALCLCVAARTEAGALETYVRQADASFAWRLRDTQMLEGIEVATLELTSQTWRGGRWTHTLYIARPGTVDLGRAEGDLINGSFRAVLMTYDTVSGADHLSDWTLVNAGGKGYNATIKAENGEVVLEYESTRGTLMWLK